MKANHVNQAKWVLAILLFTIVMGGCTKDESDNPGDPQPADSRAYNFSVALNSSALSSAVVAIRTTAQNYSASTDGQGKCRITIPNSVDLPAYVIVTVDHSSIKPNAFSVSGSSNANGNKTVNCTNAPSNVLLKEAMLHHLGDDYYTGDPNSQHQLRTEGLSKSFYFNLSGIPSTMPRLQIFARGIQNPTEIILNGIATDYLNNSSSNGDLSQYDTQLTANPQTVLRTGSNTLTIKTGLHNSSDWDDIEFCGLLLYYP